MMQHPRPRPKQNRGFVAAAKLKGLRDRNGQAVTADVVQQGLYMWEFVPSGADFKGGYGAGLGYALDGAVIDLAENLAAEVALLYDTEGTEIEVKGRLEYRPRESRRNIHEVTIVFTIDMKVKDMTAASLAKIIDSAKDCPAIRMLDGQNFVRISYVTA